MQIISSIVVDAVSHHMLFKFSIDNGANAAKHAILRLLNSQNTQILITDEWVACIIVSHKLELNVRLCLRVSTLNCWN